MRHWLSRRQKYWLVIKAIYGNWNKWCQEIRDAISVHLLISVRVICCWFHGNAHGKLFPNSWLHRRMVCRICFMAGCIILAFSRVTHRYREWNYNFTSTQPLRAYSITVVSNLKRFAVLIGLPFKKNVHLQMLTHKSLIFVRLTHL